MQPTSKFGELFQYSNPMAAAAGYTGGHVRYPDLELGAAYDRAMQADVFDPLGMTSTTFDYARAQAGNHAAAHAPDVDSKPALAVMEINYSVIPVRPAGAAWSNVKDMLKYVSMELAEGKLPDGNVYIARDVLLARRAPQVPTGKDETYGMGLTVDTEYDIPVVHHGGDMIGYHSDMIWIPGANVGAVVVTNGDPGWIIRTQFQRKLLEVLYDGKPEAMAQVEAGGKAYFAEIAAERKLLTVPADPAESAKLRRATPTRRWAQSPFRGRAAGRSSTSGSGRATWRPERTRTGRSPSSRLRPGSRDSSLSSAAEGRRRSCSGMHSTSTSSRRGSRRASVQTRCSRGRVVHPGPSRSLLSPNHRFLEEAQMKIHSNARTSREVE
jgi:hypothetical protein